MPVDEMVSTERNGVIERAASVLFAFQVGKPKLTLGEVASGASLPPSTVRRLLVQLSAAGLVHQDQETGLYSLSLRFVQLAAVALETVDLVRLAQPIMRSLTESCQEAVFLGQLDPQGVVYLSVSQPSVPIRVSTRAGEVRPAHVTSMGKVLLAFLPEGELDSWIETHPLDAATERSVSTPEKLLGDLEWIRERGYAVNYQESSMEFVSVAAPVRDHTHKVVAALAISAPFYRIDTAQIPDLGQAVVRAANQVSSRLGALSAASG